MDKRPLVLQLPYGVHTALYEQSGARTIHDLGLEALLAGMSLDQRARRDGVAEKELTQAAERAADADERARGLERRIRELEEALKAASAETTEKSRRLIGLSENAGAYLCRAEKAEVALAEAFAQIERLTAEPKAVPAPGERQPVPGVYEASAYDLREPTPAERKVCRGYKAAGWSVKAIAAAVKLPPELVRKALA